MIPGAIAYDTFKTVDEEAGQGARCRRHERDGRDDPGGQRQSAKLQAQ